MITVVQENQENQENQEKVDIIVEKLEQDGISQIKQDILDSPVKVQLEVIEYIFAELKNDAFNFFKDIFTELRINDNQKSLLFIVAAELGHSNILTLLINEDNSFITSQVLADTMYAAAIKGKHDSLDHLVDTPNIPIEIKAASIKPPISKRISGEITLYNPKGKLNAAETAITQQMRDHKDEHRSNQLEKAQKERQETPEVILERKQRRELEKANYRIRKSRDISEIEDVSIFAREEHQEITDLLCSQVQREIIRQHKIALKDLAKKPTDNIEKKKQPGRDTNPPGRKSLLSFAEVLEQVYKDNERFDQTDRKNINGFIESLLEEWSKTGRKISREALCIQYFIKERKCSPALNLKRKCSPALNLKRLW
jgi:predicted transcriptional regulator YheO